MRCPRTLRAGLAERSWAMETTSVIGTKNKKGQVYTDPRVMMNEAPRTPSFFTGSEVIKEAVRRASVDVMIAYPITPQSEAAALIGELFAEGSLPAHLPPHSHPPPISASPRPPSAPPPLLPPPPPP